jgi:diaminohydroxyphosphoribosylaminopyrimidine deaminase/5-amino-6-(5-phosphoribosylamino)uracil reductase
MAFSQAEPPVGTLVSAEDCMRLALGQGLLGAGRVSPNPLVGAVAVDAEHRYLGSGAHLEFGSSHAEANLISSLKKRNVIDRLKGGTIYVTLEPCAHMGKTPPCATQLASLPIARVIFGELDPNPLVNGKGIEILRAAGIHCEQNHDFAKRTSILTQCFFWNLQHATPFVGLKAAVSLDGVSGYSDSSRFWLTGEVARNYGHWLRLYYDGIMVGAKTVINDNPRLDCRHPRIIGRAPKRFVFDLDGQCLQPDKISRLALFSHDPEGVYWLTREQFFKTPTGLQAMAEIHALGGHCIPLSNVNTSELLTSEILLKIREEAVQSILLEGGPRLWSLFLKARAVQRLHLFQNARIFGQMGTRSWCEGLDLEEPLEFRAMQIAPLENDWVIEANVEWSSGEV